MERIVRQLERAVGHAESVLDVGCGNNSPLGRFQIRPKYSIGVDIHPPWIAESSAKAIHDEYVLLDVLGISARFGPRSFEVVLCCDLLEHLEEPDGRDLLDQMEDVARARVVVLTPNGFVPQEATWGNPYQVHRSGWSVAHLRERGYSVKGLSGLRLLRGERGTIRWRPARLWTAASSLTEPLVRIRPEFAFHLLAVKNLRRDAGDA